jgi:hypothetical protein
VRGPGPAQLAQQTTMPGRRPGLQKSEKGSRVFGWTLQCCRAELVRRAIRRTSVLITARL